MSLSPRTTTTLPSRLANHVSDGMPGLLLTVDGEGYPHTAFTWVVAVALDRLRFGADDGSTTLANLERSGLASVQIINEEGQPYLVKGNASIASRLIQSAPFKIALVEMGIVEVRDQSWIGVNVSPLAYEWAPADRDKMLEMEQAVYAEMREWQG